MDDQNLYDIAVIGAGVVGAAIARELAKYELRCVLLEAGHDVGAGTSKASTSIWHTGFDATPGTLEARLMRRSYELMGDYIAKAGIPVERTGAILVAWTEEQHQSLPTLLARAHTNGVTDVRLMSAEEIYQREPYLNQGALGGLYVPGEAIFCTFTLPLAYATQAIVNGVTLKLNFPVRQIQRDLDGVYTVQSPESSVRCRYIVNAAGLYGDEIDRLLGYNRFTVTPRRGELIVFDKLARRLVNHILLPVPTSITKGVLISPTVFGNVLLGPTAEDLPDKTDTATTAAGLHMLLDKGKALITQLVDEEVTAIYAGLRPATEHKDYQIFAHPAECYVCVGGIRSTGVSASLGIAEYVVALLAAAQLPLNPKPEFKPVQMPNIGEAAQRPYQSAALIAENPDYGRMICFCERVSVGEVIDAAHSPIPADTLDGLRRRTRVLQGRCQGFNCHAAVATLLARERGQTIQQLLSL
ncbi:MAG: NAD(P)/FAD-dependent oxidoreductase [Chloroflexi bacterium]|nr:NAD(P)/FAD-dependent oxidoreductase [Chloroflexota bacterium]